MAQGRGIDSQWLSKLRDSNDLVTLVSTYIPVIRKGRNFWANCPFHHEKTPSFSINENEQFYHCFGCGESGDVITFVMKMESLDFMSAIKFLADRCGMQMPELEGAKDLQLQKQKRDRLLSMMNYAKEYYKKNLVSPSGKKALEYLLNRGVTRDEIDKFELGASVGWQNVIDELIQKGYTKAEMKEVGLIAEKDNNSYDFFALRLMFPICNKFGDCVGFSGRDLDGKSHAKYKNSPQSLIFDKSALLYGLNIVRKNKQSAKINYIILCEGQMDTIAMHKAGFINTLASLGTAFTEIHAREISRICDKVILCYDGDSAGQHANLRAIPVLRSQGLEVRVAEMPIGQDPDEIIKSQGIEYLQRIIDSAIDSIEYEIKSLAKTCDLQDNVGKGKFVKEAINILNVFKTNSEKEIYLPLVSKMSGITIETIRGDIGKSKYNTTKIISNASDSGTKEDVLKHIPDALLKAQQFILVALMNNKKYATLPENFNLELKNENYQKLFDLLIQQKRNGTMFSMTSVFDNFGSDMPTDLADLLNIEIDNFDEIGEKYFDGCLKTIEKFRLESEKEVLQKQFIMEKDQEMKIRLLTRLNEITKQLHNI